MIGEEEATYLGVNVNRLKWIILSINVVIVAVATAFTGVISFVGLIVPHILRMMRGADNRFLIIGSALTGATLLSLADLIARLVAASGRAADRHRYFGGRRAGVPLSAPTAAVYFLNVMLEARRHNILRVGGTRAYLGCLRVVRAGQAAPHHRPERRRQIDSHQGPGAVCCGRSRAGGVRRRRHRDASELDLAKRRAVLSQAVEIAFPLTVREVVMMGRYPHFGGRPGPVDEKIVDEMMELFDVTSSPTETIKP